MATKTKEDAIVLKVPKENFYGTGKRKTAIAKVWLFKGSGQIVINDKLVTTYLPSELQRSLILKPLAVLGIEGKYDCFIRTTGGGMTGQIGAIRLGIARALIEMNLEFRKPLKEKGYLSRDSREKERKKYGLRGARKGPQYRKR